MNNWKKITKELCKTCGRDADGLPACDNYEPHQRPDGVYCDCGHEGRCHGETQGK